MIPIHDRGFTLGDGLFETVLAEAGRLRHLSAHFDRLEQGCAALGLPPPDRSAAEALMTDALQQAGLGTLRAAVRLTYSAGSGGRGLDRPEALRPRLVASAAPAPQPTGPAKLMISAVRRNEGSPTAQLKTLAYADNVLARREARAAGADEAVMLNNRGEVACAAAGNLFWAQGDRLFTPALSCGVLPGLVRGRLIAAAARRGLAVEEVACGREALMSAEAVWLTNSLIGVRPATEIDGATCGVSKILHEVLVEAERDRDLLDH